MRDAATDPAIAPRRGVRAFDWYCLRVDATAARRPAGARTPALPAPGRAAQADDPPRLSVAETILRRQGFATFQPTRTEKRPVHRRAKARRIVRSPILVGYLLVGLSPRTPGWDRLLAFRFVYGVLCQAGADGQLRPARLPPRQVARVMGMSVTVEDSEEDRDAAPLPGFAQGDLARVLGGPFEGQTVRIEEIDGELARFSAMFLGGPVRMVAPLRRLGAVA